MCMKMATGYEVDTSLGDLSPVISLWEKERKRTWDVGDANGGGDLECLAIVQAMTELSAGRTSFPLVSERYLNFIGRRALDDQPFNVMQGFVHGWNFVMRYVGSYDKWSNGYDLRSDWREAVTVKKS